MPIYEYKCEKCDTNFEILQTKNEKVVCPGCGGTSLKKMFSVFAKGSSPEGSVPTSAPGGCCPGTCGMNSGH
jgi:putative FmdB family regulatory protein